MDHGCAKVLLRDYSPESARGKKQIFIGPQHTPITHGSEGCVHYDTCRDRLFSSLEPSFLFFLAVCSPSTRTQTSWECCFTIHSSSIITHQSFFAPQYQAESCPISQTQTEGFHSIHPADHYRQNGGPAGPLRGSICAMTPRGFYKCRGHHSLGGGGWGEGKLVWEGVGTPGVGSVRVRQ